ncbi:DUF6562 domain-containing protein, partial [Bacteroides sp. 519]|uniref:DUF6562 domain-containing protein n=1 Tax=Bacteroides sp. 519 TaxID=2302937 RepID=UPI00351A505F
MKKYTNWVLFAFCALLATACQQDDNTQINEGLVDFSISTTLPKVLETRASQDGGIVNVNAANYDLRFIMEVWTKESTPRLAYRATEVVADNFATASVTFNARLQALDYNFVFWADFVNEGTTADLHYKTNTGISATMDESEITGIIGLRAIEMIGEGTGNKTYPAISTDSRDAFYGVHNINLKESNTPQSFTLKRPFGKFRIVSTDKVDGFLDVKIQSTDLVYTKGTTTGTVSGDSYFYGGFDALAGTVAADTKLSLIQGTIKPSAVWVENNITISGKTYNEVTIAAFDYLFATDESTVAFTLKTYSDPSIKTSETLLSENVLSNVPVRANKLTTLVGDFFTAQGNVDIIVDDEFENGQVIENNEFFVRIYEGAYKGDDYDYSQDQEINLLEFLSRRDGFSPTNAEKTYTVVWEPKDAVMSAGSPVAVFANNGFKFSTYAGQQSSSTLTEPTLIAGGTGGYATYTAFPGKFSTHITSYSTTQQFQQRKSKITYSLPAYASVAPRELTLYHWRPLIYTPENLAIVPLTNKTYTFEIRSNLDWTGGEEVLYSARKSDPKVPIKVQDEFDFFPEVTLKTTLWDVKTNQFNAGIEVFPENFGTGTSLPKLFTRMVQDGTLKLEFIIINTSGAKEETPYITYNYSYTNKYNGNEVLDDLAPYIGYDNSAIFCK